MSSTDQDWLIIYNPVSGGGKAKKDKARILKILEDYHIRYQIAVTEEVGHAEKLTRTAIENGQLKIMGIGGDGTVNEIINGIFGQDKVKSTDVAFSFIPVGTGNDWIRTIGIPADYAGAAKTIKTGNYFYQDVGVVTYYDDGVQKKRYFVNIAGMGYDAVVASAANRKRKGGRKMGKSTYLIQLFKCLMGYKMTKVTVSIDGGKETITDSMFSLNVGICKYNGNGMMQVPHAIPDDGIMDLTLFHKVTKMQVMQNTKNLYDGSFVSKDFVSTHSASQSIRIDSEPPVLLETDGESMGYSPFEFTLIHRGLKLISTIRNKQL